MSTDGSIVAEVRERAESISAKYHHDLREYARHLKEVERANAARVVDQVTVVRSDAGRSQSPAA